MGLMDRPRWTIAAVAVAGATLGGGALAAANGASSAPLPGAITLHDQVQVTATPENGSGLIDVVPLQILRADGDSFTTTTVSFSATDSPTFTPSVSADSVSPSVDSVSVDSPDSPDSPDSIS